MHCCCCFSRHRTTVFMWCEFGMFSTLLVAMASLDTHQVIFSEHKLTKKKKKKPWPKTGGFKVDDITFRARSNYYNELKWLWQYGLEI